MAYNVSQQGNAERSSAVRSGLPQAPDTVLTQDQPVQMDQLDQPSQHDQQDATTRGEANNPPHLPRTITTTSTGRPFSVFTPRQKRFIVVMASWAGFFSPVSANIYLPALNPLAADLNVSNSLINLTLTSYMIFQGLAPAFIGNLADTMGRRPAYMLCFVIYIAANIGLALQNSYAALFVLRCLQSTGSSATVAMASAVVSDVATPAERGAYMGFTTAGALLGPAVGPVIGGVLSQFLGWRAIFWFLTIFATVFLVVFALFFPETSRTIVGNGSDAPKSVFNMSVLNYLALRKAARADTLSPCPDSAPVPPTDKTQRRLPNPLASLKIVLDKQNALLLFYNAFLFCAFYDIAATIPSTFAAIYGFNDLQIGLCYLPFGIGSLCAALINGQLLDRNFARFARNLQLDVKKGRDQDLAHFPIEKARLQVALPASYLACVLVICFGWVLHIDGPLAAILVILFFAAFFMSVAFNVTSTLIVDFYPRRAGTATAANNLVRCLLGAGATAVIIPMINGMGRGWTFTFLGLVIIAASPMLWANYVWGMEWREQRRVRDEKRERLKEEKRLRTIRGGETMRAGVPEMDATAEGLEEKDKPVDVPK